MNSSLILSITTFVYGAAAFLYIAAAVFHKDGPGRLAFWAPVAGAGGNVAGFGLR